jgi:hypothetical protein
VRAFSSARTAHRRYSSALALDSSTILYYVRFPTYGVDREQIPRPRGLLEFDDHAFRDFADLTLELSQIFAIAQG